MPFSAGTYSAPSNTWNPAVSGIKIGSSDWNALLADLSTALSTTLLKDGSQAATAAIPFALGIKTDTITENGAGNGTSFSKQVNEAAQVTVASAATVNLDTAAANYVQITGTTTITAITLSNGRERTVEFAGALTLTNGASLILPGGASISTAAGDVAIFRGEAASVVRCIHYSPVRAATNVANTDQTLTDGATLNWDMNLGAIATVTLGGNRTMAAPTNLRKGTYVLHVIQDATGSRTITWNAVFKWPSATAPTLSTGANKRDVLMFVCDGTNIYGPPAPWLDVR